MSHADQWPKNGAAKGAALTWRRGWFGRSSMGRRLAPLFLAAIILPWVVGAIELLLQRNGLGDAQAIAIQATLATLIALGLLLWTTKTLHWHEESRRRLHEAAFRLADLVHCSDDAIVGATPAGIVTSWNQGAQKIYGYSRDEMIGRSIFSLAQPEHRRECESAFQLVIARQESQRFEATMARKGGGPVYVSLVLSPLRSTDGKATGASWISRDITQQKRAEERFHWLMDFAPDAMVIVDPGGNIVLVNEQAETIFGYSRQELLGSTVERLMPKRFRDVHVAYRREFATNPRRRDMGTGAQLYGVRKDGTEFPAEITLSPFEFAQETLVISAIRDVSERVKTEAAARHSEDQLLSFIANAPYGILRTSNIEQGGRFVSVNLAMVKMLGYDSAEEMLRLNLERDVYGDVEERRQMLDLIQRERSFRDLILHWKKRNGRILTLKVSGRIVREAENEYIESIVEDITEQRQLEQQVRQAQKMEAIGLLAAGVAHDFNNILGVILGYTELSRPSLDINHPVAKHLVQIGLAAQRATILTKQLLAFGHQQVLVPKVIDLNLIISNMVILLTRLVGRNIGISFDLSPDIGSIKADPAQIEQVVMNLAVNARDATPHDGQITIATRNVELDRSHPNNHSPIKPGPYVVLSVTDTGCGMDTETQARIFEPFFSTKGLAKGTGLGLSTVYGIVKQSEGHIWVYSELGKGTTFEIYFPRVQQAAETLRLHEPESDAPLGTETILLVEDEPALRSFTSSVLESAGYTVLAAEDSHSAIEIARQHCGVIHLLLTDVILVGMSGVDLSRKLRNVLPQLQVILMSAYGGDILARQMAEAPETELLEKPFAAKALLFTVHSTLHRESEGTSSRKAQVE